MIPVLVMQIVGLAAAAAGVSLLAVILSILLKQPKEIGKALRHKVVIAQSPPKVVDPVAVKERRARLLAEARGGN